MLRAIFLYIRIYFAKKKSKSTTKVKIKESNIDMRFYSTPSFDFSNVQSELDLRCLDFGQHCLNETRNELQVTLQVLRRKNV